METPRKLTEWSLSRTVNILPIRNGNPELQKYMLHKIRERVNILPIRNGNLGKGVGRFMPDPVNILPIRNGNPSYQPVSVLTGALTSYL